MKGSARSIHAIYNGSESDGHAHIDTSTNIKLDIFLENSK